MKLFNSTDIAELLQIKPAEAKSIYLPNGGEMTDTEIGSKLPKEYSLEELLRRRSMVNQSREQYIKIARNKTAIKNLKFPKSLRIYEAVLASDIKSQIQLAWQKYHLAEYGRLSLTEVANAAGVPVLI